MRWDWLGKEISLEMRASDLQEQVALRFCLDTFGNDAEIKAFCYGSNGPNYRIITSVDGDITHK